MLGNLGIMLGHQAPVRTGVEHQLQVTIRELDGTMEHALHIGRQPLVLGTFKIATRPSAWARRPKRKPAPGEDTSLFTESDSK